MYQNSDTPSADRITAAKVVYGSLIVSTIFTVTNVPYDAVVNAHENMKYYALVGIIESLLKLAIAFACVYSLFDKLIVYGVLMACVPLLTLTIMKVYCNRHYEECIISFHKYRNRPLMKETTSFAKWNFLGCVGGVVGNYGNIIVVNHFFGTVVNAALGAVNQMSGQMMVFSNNMMKALNPVIVKSEGGHERRKMLKYFLMGCRFSFYLLAWIAIPVAIEANYIMQLWLKNVPEWTVLFVRFQIARGLLEMSMNSLSTSLSATGQIKEASIQTMVLFLALLVILCGLFYVGFPPYWLYIVMISITLVQTVLRLQLCKKYCSLAYKQYFREVLLPLLFSTSLMLVVGLSFTSFMSETQRPLFTHKDSCGLDFLMHPA